MPKGTFQKYFKKLIPVIFVLCFFFLPFSAGADAPGVTPELRRIETADPKKDFHEAIKKGENYFIAVYGFTRYAPGLSWNEFKCVMDKIPVRTVDGTSDGRIIGEHDRLNDIAIEYAKAFNIMMFEKLLNENKLNCPN